MTTIDMIVGPARHAVRHGGAAQQNADQVG
jgi:hypothetical protein